MSLENFVPREGAQPDEAAEYSRLRAYRAKGLLDVDGYKRLAQLEVKRMRQVAASARASRPEGAK